MEPAADAYLPGAHAEQLLEPTDPVYLPAAHTMQLEALVALNLPAEHDEHDVES